jgi:hypothetical protein
MIKALPFLASDTIPMWSSVISPHVSSIPLLKIVWLRI